jgi:hypothetical protein
MFLKEKEILHHLLLWLEPTPPHKTAMAMEYLTQVTDVLITLIYDVLKKEILSSGSFQVATGKICNSLTYMSQLVILHLEDDESL